MRTHPLRILIATLVVTYGLLVATLVFGNDPKLGLDLQGGISVNLQPVEDGEVTDDVTDDQLDQAIEIIRRRVDALGVAEPEVSRQGSTISVQLPGAKDQNEVLEAVGKTARLEFRPVLAPVGSIPTGEERTEAEARVVELREQLAMPEGVTAQQVYEDETAKAAGGANAGAGDPAATPTTAPGAPSTTPPDSAAPEDSTTDEPTAGDTTTGDGGGRSAATAAAARATAQEETTTTAADEDGSTTTAPEGATTTTVPPEPQNQWGIDVRDEAFGELFGLESQLSAQITPEEERTDDGEVTLQTPEGAVYRLGPVALLGDAVETASSGLQGTAWAVNLVFRGGEDGIDRFNEIAAQCYAGQPTCPAAGAERGQLAIVLDDEIISAPTINAASFARDDISISGSFDRDSADALAVALRFGSLPIELAPQQAETVSATLGKGALQAGIISGLIGLALAAVFMLLYYRLLALVALASLVTAAAALWVIMSFLQATVTLAGVVGIVVSIGVTVDSAIVYFEVIKEKTMHGTSVRAATDRSFSGAFSTIVKANMATLIGAVILYWLAIGPVRGFALYLGAMTVLDLVFLYLIVYPATLLLSRSGAAKRPSRFGIPADDVDAMDRGAAATIVSGASS
jgi:preprotein translocase subunit SecD